MLSRVWDLDAGGFYLVSDAVTHTKSFISVCQKSGALSHQVICSRTEYLCLGKGLIAMLMNFPVRNVETEKHIKLLADFLVLSVQEISYLGEK